MIYLTKREKALNQARHEGELAYSTRSTMPHYDGDVQLQQQWREGYAMARKDEAMFNRWFYRNA